MKNIKCLFGFHHYIPLPDGIYSFDLKKAIPAGECKRCGKIVNEWFQDPGDYYRQIE